MAPSDDDYDAGWKAHALGLALPADASDDFMAGWLRRRQDHRVTLLWAAPGTDAEWLAHIADRIDL